MTTITLKSLLIGALLCAASAQAADDLIQMASADGKPIALFKIGDSRCVLIEGQIRCTLDK
jgi:hypothetical protein